MKPICDDVYAEENLDADQVEDLRRAYETASDNVVRAFETTRSTPLVIFCRTPTCKVAFGAPPGAAASDDLGFASAEATFDDGSTAPSSVVATGPVEGTVRILTHELVHAEMKAWIPYDELPTWFNEGTATLLAGEPRCAPTEAGAFDVTTLSSKARWQRHLRTSGKTRETYCSARDQVAKWMARFESGHVRAEALKMVMTSVGRGTPFEAALDAVR